MDLTVTQQIIIWAIPLLFAITLHEVAHGWVASWFGDQTARYAGRLTLNPLSHIDIIGTILVPLMLFYFSNFVFGWAKPVPVDARNMRNPHRDMAIVALAGPLSNILMAVFWGGIAKIGAILIEHHGNQWFGVPLAYMGSAGMLINVVFAALNLFPLPPLDGSKILGGLLPARVSYRFRGLEPYSFLILILLIFTNVLQIILAPIVNTLLVLLRMLFNL